MYCCAVSFIAFVSHLSASMALVVVIGEVTSVRVMVGTAYGEGDERTYPNLAGKANQWSVIGGQFRALSSRYSALILSCQARLTRTCDQFPSKKTSAGERLCISRRLAVDQYCGAPGDAICASGTPDGMLLRG